MLYCFVLKVRAAVSTPMNALSRYNAKDKLDCFNCKTGSFLALFTSMFAKESNYSHVFGERNQLLDGEYLTARRGVFSHYSLQCLQKKVITVHVFGKKKSTPVWGIFSNYKEKLSVPIVQTGGN